LFIFQCVIHQSKCIAKQYSPRIATNSCGMYQVKHMKKWIIALTFFLVCSPAWATVYLSVSDGNFDTGTPPPCWPCKTTGCNAGFNNWYCSDTDRQITTAGLSSEKAHSGTYSYKQYRPSGSEAPCDIRYFLSEPYPTTIYLRFYVYFTDSWDADCIEGTTCTDYMYHWIFFNSGQSNTGFRLNLVNHEYEGGGHWSGCPEGHLCLLPQSDGQEWYLTNLVDPDWGNSGVNFRALANQWHCIEFKIEYINNGSNIRLTWWLDGVLKQGPVTGPGTDPPNNFQNIIISGWLNQATAVNEYYYIDDIVIADSYIGTSIVTPSPQTGGDSGGGGGCLIATAAFGDDSESHVMILREFRDRVLLGSSMGRGFVRIYYRISPPIADFIKQHELLKTFIRWCLIPLVGLCWMVLTIGILPSFGLSMFLFMLLLWSYSIYSRKKRRTT